MKKIFFLLICTLTAPLLSAGQNTDSLSALDKRISRLEQSAAFTSKLRINGWAQFQYEAGQKDATLNVGNRTNENPDRSFSRIGLRRGRIRMDYTDKYFRIFYQIDFTENSIGIRDALMDIHTPWSNNCFLRAGIFFRPFGFEVGYSSASRETPERSTVIRTLFPNYRDMGAMIVFRPSDKSPYNFIRLEAGLFAGNGINAETDSRRDFIGRLVAINNNRQISWRAGVSLYEGSVFQGTQNVFTMSGNSFVLNQNESNLGGHARRAYAGIEGEIGYNTPIGRSIVRGEYLWGQQPGSETSSESPRSSARPAYDTYIRNFSGWYVYYVQYVTGTPLMAVLKYDRYDPNTKARGNNIGAPGSGTTPTDLAVDIFGFGVNWIINPAWLVMAYYEIPRSETTENILRYNNPLKANMFTLRLQGRF